MFYNFRQNNSGGFYVGPKCVVVRANSSEEANNKAVNSGIVYFNGVRDGKDCDCCGNRWYQVNDYDATETPSYGDDQYSIPDLETEFEGKLTYDCLGFADTLDFKYIP